jgi:membrane dipeptidase
MKAFARKLHRRSLLRIATYAGAAAAVCPWLQACQGWPFGAPQIHSEDRTMQDRWLVVDGHIDIAFNAILAQRDPSLSVTETRQREVGSEMVKHGGTCTVGLPELIRGRVGIVFGTLYVAPYNPNMMPPPPPPTSTPGAPARPTAGPPPNLPAYKTADEAYHMGMAQLEYYHQWAARDKRVKIIGTRKDLDSVVSQWGWVIGADGAINQLPMTNNPPDPIVGLVPLMEGADPIREPKELAFWMERGLRIVGLAWAATRYAGGSWAPGTLTDLGRELIKEIARLDAVLDVSHLAQDALTEVLDIFEGKFIIASHSNPQALVPTPRHLPDRAIKEIARRGGVMGTVLANSFINPQWGKGDLTRKEDVTVDDVVKLIDYSCQLVGAANHIAIGSDFDGGFGVEAVPKEFDSSADPYKIGEALLKKGYTETDVRNIMGGNWIRLLSKALK